MTRIWFCRTCGYEVRSRGRCHNCRQKLTPSALPEMEAGPEDEEVGYNIEGWSESDRGALIERLNDLGIVHRFEEEELVVDTSDEGRVDDLVAVLADSLDLSSAGTEPGDDTALDDLDGSGSPAAAGEEPVDPALDAAVRLLADAATRLHRDPTDMQADADVAEASAAVFITDTYGPLDEETWTAVGRVTRRLLSLLGADEALEDGIRSEAAVLEKLLTPVAGSGGRSTLDLGAEGAAALGGAVGGAPIAPAGGVEGEKTVYELPEWMPEHRAQLGVLLDQAGIAHDWEGDELIVPASREEEVEDLFGQVRGVDSEESDEDYEARYQAVAELFAACGRLASEPSDDQRRQAVVGWISRSAGPPLFGMDEVDWFRITSRARILETAIGEGGDNDLVAREAATLHDILRAVV